MTLSQRWPGADSGRRATITRRIRNGQWTNEAKDESRTVHDEAEVSEIRDQFFPKALSKLFFFDAERVEGVNLEASQVVQDISSVLGLDVYRDLKRYLSYAVRNSVARDFESTKVQDLREKVTEIESRIEKKNTWRRGAEDSLQEVEFEIEDLKSQLEGVERQIQRVGGDEPQVLRELERKREELDDQKKELEAQRKEAWETAVPLALLSPIRSSLAETIEAEERRRDWSRKRDAVEPLIPGVVYQVFEQPDSGFELDEGVREYYRDRLKSALLGLFNPPPEGMAEGEVVTSASTAASVLSLLGRPTHLAVRVAEASEQIEKLKLEIGEIEQRLERSATADSAQLYEHRGQLRQKLAGKEEEKSRLQQEIARLHDEIEAEHINLGRAVNNLDRAERGKRIETWCRKYMGAAEEVRRQVAHILREEVARITGELWTQIVDRGHEFDGIDFDQDWACYLVRRDGSRLPWGQFNASAGQKQVRVLAFYEALRQLADAVPPLVADTPLGRLDRSVRQGVLERIYLSGHQSVLLCTDSEVIPSGDLHALLAPKVARSYTLNPFGDPEAMDYHVHVTADYFGASDGAGR